MSDYPERISISPTSRQKREDDFFLVDRKAFPGKGTEYVRADRIEELEAKLAKAVEALTQIERAYYQEATNPGPETIRRMAARMNGIARDAQNAIAELTGEPEC